MQKNYKSHSYLFTFVKGLVFWEILLINSIAESDQPMFSSRLVCKVENLEHLMNEEATDINEMLSVISNIQTGKEGVDIKALKKRYM